MQDINAFGAYRKKDFEAFKKALADHPYDVNNSSNGARLLNCVIYSTLYEGLNPIFFFELIKCPKLDVNYADLHNLPPIYELCSLSFTYSLSKKSVDERGMLGATRNKMVKTLLEREDFDTTVETIAISRNGQTYTKAKNPLNMAIRDDNLSLLSILVKSGKYNLNEPTFEYGEVVPNTNFSKLNPTSTTLPIELACELPNVNIDITDYLLNEGAKPTKRSLDTLLHNKSKEDNSSEFSQKVINKMESTLR